MSLYTNKPENTLRAGLKLLELLKLRNWEYEDLAVAIGMSKMAVHSAVSGVQLQLPCRRRVECILGPVFSTPEEFEEVNRAQARLGCDPLLTLARDVKNAAIARGIVSPFATVEIVDVIKAAAKLPDDYQPPAHLAIDRETLPVRPVRARSPYSLGLPDPATLIGGPLLPPGTLEKLFPPLNPQTPPKRRGRPPKAAN